MLGARSTSGGGGREQGTKIGERTKERTKEKGIKGGRGSTRWPVIIDA